jgi:hypothetical protein
VRRLDLECGDRFFHGWTNVDFSSHSPGCYSIPFAGNNGFRRAGEIHQWMYRFSLKLLLEQRGFGNVQRVDAYTRTVEGWEECKELDQAAGKIRKPDSLFVEEIEGVRPRVCH